MMGRALLIVGAMATFGVVASAVLGYLVGSPTDLHSHYMTRHILIALASSMLLLFSHCWIMFYLIGTGKAIKDAVREHGLDPAFAEETKRFKNASYPWLMLAMGLVMATFILGGGVHKGSIPSWVHHVLFYVALLAQIYALRIEQRVLTDNERLMAEVDRRLAAA
jgi:4-hydroxybenzoate polyprenyltransferase